MNRKLRTAFITLLTAFFLIAALAGCAAYTDSAACEGQDPAREQPEPKSIGSIASRTRRCAGFPKDLLKRLEEKAAAGISEEDVGTEIEKGYSILDLAEGDLDGDGRQDAAVVVQHDKSREQCGSRRVFVLMGMEKGGYRPAASNGALLLGSEEGGAFGDPYDGIAVAERSLRIYEYGGSSFRWAYEFCFEQIQGCLMLKKWTCGNWYNFTGGGTVETYDYENHSYTMVSDCFTEELSGFSGLKLMELPFSCEMPSFEQTSADTVEEARRVSNFPLPDLGWYEYGAEKQPAPRLSPEEALDQVQRVHYPEMERISLPWTKEMKANYESLLGYPAPDFYYKDGKAELWYFKLESGEHVILWDDEGAPDKLTFYRISDEDGEEL